MHQFLRSLRNRRQPLFQMEIQVKDIPPLGVYRDIPVSWKITEPRESRLRLALMLENCSSNPIYEKTHERYQDVIFAILRDNHRNHFPCESGYYSHPPRWTPLKLEPWARSLINHHAEFCQVNQHALVYFRWLALVQLHTAAGVEYSTLVEATDDLRQIVETPNITPEQALSIIPLLHDVVQHELEHLGRHRLIFHNDNTTEMKDLQILLKFLHSVFSLLVYMTPINMETSRVMFGSAYNQSDLCEVLIPAALTTPTRKWFDMRIRSLQLNDPSISIENKCDTLKLFIEFICSDLQSTIAQYHKLFNSVVNLDYFGIIYAIYNDGLKEHSRDILKQTCVILDNFTWESELKLTEEVRNAAHNSLELYRAYKHFCMLKTDNQLIDVTPMQEVCSLFVDAVPGWIRVMKENLGESSSDNQLMIETMNEMRYIVLQAVIGQLKFQLEKRLELKQHHQVCIRLAKAGSSRDIYSILSSMPGYEEEWTNRICFNMLTLVEEISP